GRSSRKPLHVTTSPSSGRAQWAVMKRASPRVERGEALQRSRNCRPEGVAARVEQRFGKASARAKGCHIRLRARSLLRSGTTGSPLRDAVPKKRGSMRTIAIVSEHASPLCAVGGVDAGGQNIYVANVARELARLGLQVDVYTRSDNAS